MIDGVQVKQLKRHADERGFLMEIMRTDYELFNKFAQAYVSKNYPGVIRAWHYHKKQEDYWVCLSGMIKTVIYDCREGSPTYGEVNEFFMGDDNPIMVKIPIGTMHGYKTVGTQPSLLINFPTELYNPKEPDEYREKFDSDKIPYDWNIKIT
ncbi:MAG: dTDP-4-dehydrorhamnose 3,5-epimerase family protein [Abditibacteriota bacterium]|jgi:dTDP-4-dehydrorhamnose 3,5-epimerase|nr:dTDP-4-dehydrorhamnose 3,5-epimerase family protein [Abditibacteriota bacterium]MBP5092662.1 dTDP-4-dehydrorhamnose 3,5-epimerase family protein [Abditibacteriota bacterium]MBP5737540.1 dTDP-4-dehydrorhamnose 3,5-epimerase family protein [Abditibacteriota bacterium]MBQ7524811.1 dTDP-4-dehydrorhamnose 3,5-epimerase family protein [Abditibacteriota bacterium]